MWTGISVHWHCGNSPGICWVDVGGSSPTKVFFCNQFKLSHLWLLVLKVCESDRDNQWITVQWKRLISVFSKTSTPHNTVCCYALLERIICLLEEINKIFAFFDFIHLTVSLFTGKTRINIFFQSPVATSTSCKKPEPNDLTATSLSKDTQCWVWRTIEMTM